MNKLELSVIMPNWNGKEFLEVALRSLRIQNYTNFEVIVIDNGSNDNSVEFLENYFPEVNIIKLSKNYGFSFAVNRGIKAAKGEYILLLNNDVEIEKNCLQKLTDSAKRNKDIAIFACKMLYFNDRGIINDAGNFFSAYGYAIQRGNSEKDEGQYDVENYIFSACAGAAMYRRELFDKIGFFDEDFFAYLEDVDFGFRSQLAGYKSEFVPNAIVYHVEGGTSKRLNNFAILYNLRNNLFLITKNMPIGLLLLFSPFILIYQIRNMLVAIENRYFKKFIKIYFDYFKHFSALMEKRKIIQKSKKGSNYYIFKILSKKYPFSITRAISKRIMIITRYYKLVPDKTKH
jgi:GT2 family glycosyltransferase